MPGGAKPPIPPRSIRQAPPDELRRLTVDGNFGGSYERPEAEELEVWRPGGAEERDLLEHGWRTEAWAGRAGGAGHRHGAGGRRRDRRRTPGGRRDRPSRGP